MNETLKAICKLLGEKAPETQIAAARVLGELRLREKEVAQVLGEALAAQPPAAVRAAVIEALGRCGEAGSLKFLLPELTAGGEPADQAILAAVAIGQPILQPVLDLWETAAPELQLALVRILAGIGGSRSYGFLFKLLPTANPEILRAVVETLYQRLAPAESEMRRAVVPAVRSFLSSPAAEKNPAATSHVLRLLEVLDEPWVEPELLRRIGEKEPPVVRRGALLALARRPAPAAAPAAGGEAASTTPVRRTKEADLVRRLLPMLGEADFANVVSSALEVLKDCRVGREQRGQLKALRDSPHEAVRRFAVRALAETGGERDAAELLAGLDSDSPSERVAADEALRRMPAAAGLLVKRLDRSPNFEKARETANILIQLKERLGPRELKLLAATLCRHLDAGDDRGRPVLWILRSANPPALRAALLARARELLRRDRAAEAAATLEHLRTDDLLDDEVRYELVVAAIRASTKSLTRQERAANRGLLALVELLRAAAPGTGRTTLARRIIGEKRLRAEDFFYVGFHFAERLGEERLFGADLLVEVVRRWPRSPAARTAADKLRLEGLDPILNQALGRHKKPAAGAAARRPEPAKPAARPKPKPAARKPSRPAAKKKKKR